MLDLIRKKKKSVIVKVVFWTIIAAFVGTIFLVWGKGSDQGGQGVSVAVTVNETRISFEDYQRAYSNLYRLYQNIYRDQFTPAMEKQLRLRQQALDSLIDETLLLQEAGDEGLDISKKELVDSIAQIPAFQENGVFSKDRYLQVLSYQRLTPEDFETMQQRQLLIEKMGENLQSGIAVTDEDIEQEYRNQNEKVNLSFVKLPPALFENRVKVSEEELRNYFTDHREEFRIPESVALRYLQFEPDRYADQVTFDEEELNKYYRRHLDQFEIEEQVKASHILLRVDESADEAVRAKKRELAEKILKDARAGKDFDKLARTHSDDAGSASQGGDLGYFSRGAMVAPFEKAAFALNPGEISEIVETPFGYHIIKVEEYIEAGVRPLADVLDKVKESLREEKARQLAFEKAMDAYNINRRTGDLESAAAANNLGIKETGSFSRGEPIDGIDNAEEISSVVFTLKEGELHQPVNLPQGIFLFKVKERRESRLPELDEVRSRVEQAFRSEKSKELARQAAEEILAGLKEDKTLKALAGKFGVKAEETDFFTRSYGAFVPRLGSAEDLASAAFTLTEAAPVAEEVFTVDDKFVVARLKEVHPADMSGLDQTKRDEIKGTLLSRKQEEALNSKLRELREASKIVIAPNLQTTFERE
jgi:peptidyl-prolyl cis-trans isomerase D